MRAPEQSVIRRTGAQKMDPGAEYRPAPPPARTHRTLLMVAAFLLAVIVTTHNIGKGEFNLITDETVNAVTGLFFADFIRDLPLTHAVQYTYQHYAQYPELGLFHWPPFLHLVEGIMFLLLGPSAVTARLTVLMFALLGVFFWFKLVGEFQNDWTAAVSSALLVFHPSLLLFEKSVMPEVPSLALCIAAIYFYTRYLRQGASRYLYWFALFSSLALLTRYQTVYLTLYCLLTMLFARKWSLAFNTNVLRAFAVGCLLVGPYYFLALKVHGRQLAALAIPGSGSASALSPLEKAGPWTYYWEKLPAQLGWPLLALSLIGVATSKWWSKKGNLSVMLLWIAACYVTMSYLSAKEPRYIIFWLPPFLYFAVGPLTAEYSRAWMRFLGSAVALGLLVSYLWLAWTFQRPYVSGYASLARQVTQSDGSGISLIVFDGSLPGNFMFYVRKYDPARRFYVLRKSLYVVRAAGRPDTELIHTREELEDFIDRYGIKDVVVSDNGPIYFGIQKILRDFLRTPHFRLAGKFLVESNDPELQAHNMLWYENTRVKPRTAHSLTLKMFTLEHDIVVPLDVSPRQ